LQLAAAGSHINAAALPDSTGDVGRADDVFKGDHGLGVRSGPAESLSGI
jgi:hypothetical protein